ncbi:spore cortex-lytic enzyme [Alkalicoccobacillus murimartini]|uniref:Spore cortex-lytic enzyme n=1 Tax=Alkalicoccobacillus murimartini TaxID=171685 RepID=A0ABT9YDF9_9BACI|nr:spore cortex-lytic enzyme [Alkalicoccobacillus murimartini]MDQ0205896.1 N-acetylmuramoyl-L-alanine amidase [Alkalicoccobacillus murimartini]
MNRNRQYPKIKKVWLGLIVALCISTSLSEEALAFSEQIIQKGSTGDDVVELQARLQYNGFFTGKIDGVYGWGTYWAVRNFQNDFGMTVDGLVGDDMKQRLAKSTKYDEGFVQNALNEGRKFTHYGGTPKEKQQGPKGSAKGGKKGGQAKHQPSSKQKASSSAGNKEGTGGDEQPQKPENDQPTVEKANNVPSGYSDNDIRLMAQAVYGEARGEPYVGQVAVAAVIINRINSATFPNTVSEVIYEPRAFTAVADGQIYNEPDETARKAVIDALNGQDPTGNAIYYFNPVTATSDWIWSREQIKRIGKHIFCY